MMPILIHIRETLLSDGSPVYGIEIGGTDLPAITLNDAETLAEGIKRLIEDHTNETAEIRFHSFQSAA